MARSFEVYEPVMDIFSIILQGFTKATRLASLLCCINTPKLQTGAANEKCLRSNPQIVISRNRRHLCEIDWTLNSSAVCISKQKYETRDVEGHTQLDKSTLAIPQDGYRARFSPCGSFVLSDIRNPTIKNSVNLVLNGYYSHTHAHK
jgi:hypothetical protein